MIEILEGILKEEDAQDVVEYTLLLSFSVLGSAALFLDTSNSIVGIWSTVNRSASRANSMAAS